MAIFVAFAEQSPNRFKELNDVGRRQEALQANLDRLTERISNEYSVDLANPEDVERVEYSQPEADMLYGVTQEIKGISRIASVQLADATKFAI